MNYILVPSLQHITLVQVVAALWNQEDIRCLIKSSVSTPSLSRPKIEDKVEDKLQQLLIPQPLKEKGIHFIKPIGLQIFNWLQYHCSDLYLLVQLPAEFSWTPQGAINRKTTAEMIIKDENIDLCTRYKLACIYCLEDYIHKLWNIMPEYHRKYFLNQGFLNMTSQKNEVYFWSLKMKQEMLYVSYKTLFETSALDGNKVAAEFFLKKLTPREREQSLFNVANRVTNSDIFIYLLSQLKEEQQIEVFKNNSSIVVQSFTHWPFQSFFIAIIESGMWKFLSKDVYPQVLQFLIQKICDGDQDWDYKKLFMEFWPESPFALNKFDTDEFNNKGLESLLYHIHQKDKEIVKFTLENVTLTVKKKLIYCNWMKFVFQTLILDEKWIILELFLRECLPSEDEMAKFKEEFEKSTAGQRIKYNLASENWTKLFKFK